nr:hypothetical protein [Candidatus Sigynarchaeota archaeon]
MLSSVNSFMIRWNSAIRSNIVVNIVVIGILASFFIMAFGMLLMPVRRDHGTGLLLDGIILCGVLCGLSAVQLGAGGFVHGPRGACHGRVQHSH